MAKTFFDRLLAAEAELAKDIQKLVERTQKGELAKDALERLAVRMNEVNLLQQQAHQEARPELQIAPNAPVYLGPIDDRVAAAKEFVGQAALYQKNVTAAVTSLSHGSHQDQFRSLTVAAGLRQARKELQGQLAVEEQQAQQPLSQQPQVRSAQETMRAAQKQFAQFRTAVIDNALHVHEQKSQSMLRSALNGLVARFSSPEIAADTAYAQYHEATRALNTFRGTALESDLLTAQTRAQEVFDRNQAKLPLAKQYPLELTPQRREEIVRSIDAGIERVRSESPKNRAAELGNIHGHLMLQMKTLNNAASTPDSEFAKKQVSERLRVIDKEISALNKTDRGIAKEASEIFAKVASSTTSSSYSTASNYEKAPPPSSNVRGAMNYQDAPPLSNAPGPYQSTMAGALPSNPSGYQAGRAHDNRPGPYASQQTDRNDPFGYATRYGAPNTPSSPAGQSPAMQPSSVRYPSASMVYGQPSVHYPSHNIPYGSGAPTPSFQGASLRERSDTQYTNASSIQEDRPQYGFSRPEALKRAELFREAKAASSSEQSNAQRFGQQFRNGLNDAQAVENAKNGPDAEPPTSHHVTPHK